MISTTSNVAPREVKEIFDSFRAGELERARRCHYTLLPLFDALFGETNPIPVKAACAALGWCDPEIRLPLLTVVVTPVEHAEHMRVVQRCRRLCLGPESPEERLVAREAVMKDLGILQ